MLKVVAVTGPHWVLQNENNFQLSLNSKEPFSLYNAVRFAAHLAQNKIGPWGDSNWNTVSGCNESIMLYEYYENQKNEFINLLIKIKPNLLLIGTMSIGFAGAIEIAKIAKQLYSNEVFIVIGGKHIIETTYLLNGKISQNGNCTLQLLKTNKIPPVFDLVLAGEGEEMIVEIGKVIYKINKKDAIQDFYKNASKLLEASGNWLAGWVDENNEIQFLESTKQQIDQNNMPNTINLFGIKSNFPIFDSDITAHTYSHMSKGCIFNCFFCSEKSGINGKIQQLETAPDRLFRQFIDACNYGLKNNLPKVSAFVEDSILLAGKVELLNKLNELLKSNNIRIKFGGQFTSDLLNNKEVRNIVTELANNGLSYLFIGLETNNEGIADEMSKNTNKRENWIKKNEQVLEFLKSVNIKCGFSILFGLGETHTQRIDLLKQIKVWQNLLGAPHVVSLNYATQHPLKDYNSTKFDYINWGTSSQSPRLTFFTKLFGEATENYILPNTQLVTIRELEEIQNLYLDLNLKRQ